MKINEFLNDLSKRLNSALPEGIKTAKNDMEKNFHAILLSAFSKLELVTREEFDAQTKVLARTRKKLEDLEKKLYEMEKIFQDKTDE